MEIVKIIIWPITFAIIVVFIVVYFNSTLRTFIKNISRIKYGKIDAELTTAKQVINEQRNELALLDNQPDAIERAVNLFSFETAELIKASIEKESNLSGYPEVNKKFERLYKYTQSLYSVLYFERIYTVIYGSQLQVLNTLNSGSLSKDALKGIYERAKESYPFVYASYGYNEYLSYIKGRGLIIIDEKDLCTITWLGRDFLKFLVETGKSFSKAY